MLAPPERRQTRKVLKSPYSDNRILSIHPRLQIRWKRLRRARAAVADVDAAAVSRVRFRTLRPGDLRREDARRSVDCHDTCHECPGLSVAPMQPLGQWPGFNSNASLRRDELPVASLQPAANGRNDFPRVVAWVRSRLLLSGKRAPDVVGRTIICLRPRHRVRYRAVSRAGD